MSQDQLFSLTEERRPRQEAVGCATASGWELSDFKIDPPTQERARLYVDGHLSWHEFCDLQR